MGWGHSVIMPGRVSLNRKVSRGLVIDCIKEPEHAEIRAARQAEYRYIYMYACMCNIYIYISVVSIQLLMAPSFILKTEICGINYMFTLGIGERDENALLWCSLSQ